jgi:tRNA pseudouridine55 synthase
MNFQKEGLYLINKPRGRSSFSIVAQVRRLSGIKKVGHAGTLDPEAEGLLVVLLGKEYTKQAEKYSKLDKTYEFEVKLGEVSTTDDEEGDKTEVSGLKPTKAEIIKALSNYEGEIEQTPPVYSAIKIDGQRAYKRARNGEEVEMPTRKINIKSIELLDYKYPFASIKADVSSGTYIRSLARSIGEDLKTGAYCTKIVRTRVGEFSLDDALAVD